MLSLGHKNRPSDEVFDISSCYQVLRSAGYPVQRTPLKDIRRYRKRLD